MHLFGKRTPGFSLCLFMMIQKQVNICFVEDLDN